MQKTVPKYINSVTLIPFFSVSIINPFIKCLFFSVCLFFTGSLSAQNLVINSTFDGGHASPWEFRCNTEVSSETNYGGTEPFNYVAEIDQDNCYQHSMCILSGTTYTISLKASRSINPLTPPNPGFVITVTGSTTGTVYLNQTTNRNNTTWDLTTSTYSFTIPSGSADRYVTLRFDHPSDLTGEHGVVIDDIELHPAADMFITGMNQPTAVMDSTYTFSLANALPSITRFNWIFDASATPAASEDATPSVSWNPGGAKNIYLSIENGSCTVYAFGLRLLVGGTLPLQFTSLTGNVINDKAIITWTTADEQNSSHFIIERSTNGIQYEPIAMVKCNNTPGTHTYSYTDPTYNAPSFYRLKQVDVNGFAQLSSVVIIKKSAGTFGLSLYPSMTNTSLSYAVTVKQPATATVQVLNTTGQTVITRTIQLLQGVNVNKLDVSKLPAGQYFLKLSMPGQANGVSKSFIKG